MSRTLNYYVSDAAIAGAAATLGMAKDAATLNARAAKYQLYFDVRACVWSMPSLLPSSLPPAMPSECLGHLTVL